MMAYRTCHRLEMEPEDPRVWERLEDARRKEMEIGYALGELGWNEPASWDSYLEDMVELSKGFPGVTFTLYGDGDENGDLWVAYFRNGQFQEYHPEIVFPQIDEQKWEELKKEESNGESGG